jgi:glycosyltransferase involved in cell wall biosynthesis
MKKGIVFLGSFGIGGISRVAISILPELLNNFNIKVIQFHKGKYETKLNKPKNIEIIYLLKNDNFRFYRIDLLILSLYRYYTYTIKEKPDFVLSMGQIQNFFNVLFKNKYVSITSQHNIWSKDAKLKYSRWRRYILKKINKFFLSKSALIISISEGVKSDLIDTFCIDSDKIKVIYNPTDVKNIIKLSKDGMQYKLSNNTFNLIVVGRLTYSKGIDILINSMLHLDDDINLYIIGDGELNLTLKELVIDNGLENRVHFLGFQENPYKYISRADLFILPCRWEGFGNVLVEALACRTPVLSFNCPVGPNEILSDYEVGFLLNNMDAYSLSKKILEIKSLDKYSLSNIVDKGYLRSLDFDSVKVSKEYVINIDKVLS